MKPELEAASKKPELEAASSGSFAAAHPSLGSALARRGYTVPTAVQTAVLEAERKDLLVSAQTGSGKTVAFGLAMGNSLLGDKLRFERAGEPLALVITPTRELAQQVHGELTWLFADTGARITTCVGGMDPRRERHALQSGVHVVVGTPGRLCDHLERGALSLAKIQVVILDEADEMLDMGFREDLERLLDASPKERRTLLFSATIPKDIAQLAKRYQNHAQRVATTSETERHHDIEYRAIPIIPREREHAVVNLLRFHEETGALVFCATRDGVTHLAANLSERGFHVAALSGELSQRERNAALQALRDGRARVCVATDVAARGLDLPDLGLVIHADLPQNAQTLVHRSGRTGRAGKRGTAIVLVPDPARRHVERMLRTAHVEATWSAPPTAEDILGRDGERMVTEIGALAAQAAEVSRAPDASRAEASRAAEALDDRLLARTLLAQHAAEDLVAVLVRSRRDARPSPEELTIPPSMRPRASRDERRDDRPHGRPREERRDDRPHGRPREDRPQRDDARPKRAWAERESAQREQRSTRGAEPQGDARSQREPWPKREPRAPRPEREVPGVWFTINVGRSKNADPKWLIPLLCRRGDITKREIGRIEILMRETRVEIAPDASAAFAEAIRRPDDKDRNIHIEPLEPV